LVEKLENQGDRFLIGSKPTIKQPVPLIPSYPYTYLYNISNRLSQQFYGAKDLSAYELKGGDGPIMQCRHCIRFALGYCVKHGGQRPTWKEPLSLVLGDGRRFRLEFDCKHCQMNVFVSE
jgi:putative protease